MASKTSFTPEEWQLLMEGIMSSGVAVTAADPSGLWGLLKEGMASAGTLVEAKNNPKSSELLKAIVADIETSEGRSRIQDGLRKKFKDAKPGEVKMRSIDALQQASRLLDAKAPEEAVVVKGLMKTIGERVAQAASEGGVLGFGGVKVSEPEKATLAEIAKALSLPA